MRKQLFEKEKREAKPARIESSLESDIRKTVAQLSSILIEESSALCYATFRSDQVYTNMLTEQASGGHFLPMKISDDIYSVQENQVLGANNPSVIFNHVSGSACVVWHQQ